MTSTPGRNGSPTIDEYKSLMQANRQLREEFRPIYLRELRVKIPMHDFVRFMENFVDPDYVPKDYKHIKLKPKESDEDLTMDLLAMGKAADTCNINFSKLGGRYDIRDPVGLLYFLIPTATEWYDLVKEEKINSMRLEYRAEPGRNGEHRYHLIIDFNTKGDKSYTLRSRKDSSQHCCDVVCSIMHAMGLDTLKDGWAPMI